MVAVGVAVGVVVVVAVAVGVGVGVGVVVGERVVSADRGRAPIRVNGPAREQLDALKARLEKERGRRVSYTEVIEQLLALRADVTRIEP